MTNKLYRLWALLLPACLAAQVFNPGSNGSDGDLTFPTAKVGDVIIFDPRDTTMFPGGLDLDNDNVYHFKTITIPAGVRVVLRADKLGGPVYFLAQGNVTINGHLDADGNGGAANGFVPQTFAVPGPGGFYGGGGGDTGSRPPTAGFGPTGGAAWDKTRGGCEAVARGGGITVNDFLVPLIGGSGGGGFVDSAPSIGQGGGAGGGAILIATPGTIAINSPGLISARGGNQYSRGQNNSSGFGGGGSIRLLANRIQGNGSVLTNPVGTDSWCGQANGGAGKIRFEAFQQAFGGTVTGTLLPGSPFDTFVPTTGSSLLRVVSVAGVAVNPNPTGSFQLPDVTVNRGVPAAGRRRTHHQRHRQRQIHQRLLPRLHPRQLHPVS
ncbi:MAG: hypothetical protein NTV70_22805 [Acidobacteria bacterium]|nr:hypothetical protein [Acidobacteriota bacterium]